MYISEISSIKNYRNLIGLELSFHDEINFIVGENNLGKTNIIEMLNAVISVGKFNENDFYDTKESIEIIFKINYDDDELGFFENNFDIDNEYEITIKAIQEDVDARLEYYHNESGVPISSRRIKALNFIYYSVSQKQIPKQDKYLQIHFNLSSNSLKRLMNEIDEKVFLTTIHGSKGLEWDYVYIPEIMDYQFPTSRALCKECASNRAGIKGKYDCKFTYASNLKQAFLEELSLMYVAITRAKVDAYAFANVDKKNGIYKRRSCLTNLPNLVLNRKF